MKALLILLVTHVSIVVGQDSSYTIQRTIPAKIVMNPLNLNFPKDTITTSGQSFVVHESKKDMLNKLADTVYLNKITGDFIIGEEGIEIKIKRKNKTLSILMPGSVESDLIPIGSWLFRLKNNPGTKMFLFFDQRNNVVAINIQNAKENYSASRRKR